MYWNTFTVPYGHGNNKINILYFSFGLATNIIKFTAGGNSLCFFTIFEEKVMKKTIKSVRDCKNNIIFV